MHDDHDTTRYCEPPFILLLHLLYFIISQHYKQMSMLRKIGFVSLMVAFIIPIIMAIFTFFGVPFETYANYIMWAIALGIFICIIPVGKLDTFR